MVTEAFNRENWIASDDLGYHQKQAGLAHGVIDANLAQPADNRFSLAYDVVAAGEGQRSVVLALGPSGNGKSALGELMIGADRRVDFDGLDTRSTLFGHLNPIDPSEYIPGKFQDKRTLDPADPVLFGNEAGDLPNTRVINPLFEKGVLVINGKSINIQELAGYLTANFKGENVYGFDDATLSRIAAIMLTGDMPEDMARKIQGFVTSRNGSAPSAAGPILPMAETRRAISELVASGYVDPPNRSGDQTVVGDYTVDLIQSLNETGLVKPINISDARIGQAVATVTRAHMFGNQIRSGTPITPLFIARAAAFVLPKVVSLSNETRQEIQYRANDSRMSDLDREVIVRRLIADKAFELAYRSEQQRVSIEAGQVIPLDQFRGSKDQDVNNYAFANADVMRPEMRAAAESVLSPAANGEASDANSGQAQGERNGLRRFVSRRRTS